MPKLIKNCLHSSLRVKDLDATLHFYHDIFGFERMFTMMKKDLYRIQERHDADTAPESDQPWLLYLRIAEQQYLEIFPVPDETVSQFDGRQSFFHISFHLEDLVHTVTELIRRGVPVYSTTFDMSNGKRLREGFAPFRAKDGSFIAWTKDPDGNLINLVQLTNQSLQLKFDQPENGGRQTDRRPQTTAPGQQLISNCSHLAFRVKDFDASMRFYQDVLGLQKMFVLTKQDLYETELTSHNDSLQKPAPPQDPNAVWLVYLKIKHREYLELFPVPNEEVSQFENCQSFGHFSLQVESIVETVTELIRCGIPVYNTSFDMKIGKTLKEGFVPFQAPDSNFIAWIADPDGNLIELMQLTKQSLQRKYDHP